MEDVHYQSEGSQDRQPLYIGETQLHQTEANNDAVKDIPALLEVIVGIHGDQLQHHLSCEDPSEDLEIIPRDRKRSEVGEGRNLAILGGKCNFRNTHFLC